MASTQSIIDFILDQIAVAGIISARKMFGEYGIYCNGKIVAFLCNDQLFVKPTNAGRGFVGECTEIPPYPKAKPYFFIQEDKWYDQDWLSRLIILTANELPFPKTKRSHIIKLKKN